MVSKNGNLSVISGLKSLRFDAVAPQQSNTDKCQNGFVLFFELKNISLTIDGRNRCFQDIYDCLAKQWQQLSATTRSVFMARQEKRLSVNLGMPKTLGVKSFCKTNGDLRYWSELDSNSKTKYKCQDIHENLLDQLEHGRLLDAEVLVSGEKLYSIQNGTSAGWHLLSKDIQDKYESRVIDFKQTFVPLTEDLNCTECSANFARTEKLKKNHFLREHLFVCKSCLSRYDTLMLLQIHLLQKHQKPSHGCEFCQEVLLSQEDAHKHVLTKHFQDIGLRRSDPLVTTNASSKKKLLQKAHIVKGLICIECQVSFDTKAKLKYHRLKVHGKWQGVLQCSLCDKSYGTESNLRKHLRIAHNSGPLVQGSPAAKVCLECEYKTYDSYHLKIHMRKHTGERPFTCSKCKYGFYKKSDQVGHENKCKGVKYQCSKCQDTFHFQRQLEEHSLWSEKCGTICDKTDGSVSPIKDAAGSSRYMSEKPSIVRVNADDKSIVGINCDNLVDEKIFTKRSKRSRCGICAGCERISNCNECKSCLKKSSKRIICTVRKCLNLITQFDVKKDQKTSARHVLQRFASVSSDVASTSATAFLDVCSPDDEPMLEEMTEQDQHMTSSDFEHNVPSEDLTYFDQSASDNLMLLTDAAAIDFQDSNVVIVHNEEVVLETCNNL
jgi:hypothetical protein